MDYTRDFNLDENGNLSQEQFIEMFDAFSNANDKELLDSTYRRLLNELHNTYTNKLQTFVKKEAQSDIGAKETTEHDINRDKRKSCVIYTDGSFKEGKSGIGWGFVFLDKNNKPHDFLGYSRNEKLTDMRNVGGEILAVSKALAVAHEANYDDVLLCYDYTGLGFWADGSWQAKNDMTRRYKDMIQEYRDTGMNIEFSKVDAHTGVIYNEKADKLAKRGLDEGYEKFIKEHPERVELGEESLERAMVSSFEDKFIKRDIPTVHSSEHSSSSSNESPGL